MIGRKESSLNIPSGFNLNLSFLCVLVVVRKMMVASGFVFCPGYRDQQSGGGGRKGSKGILFGPAQASATQQVYQRSRHHDEL